ncbi:UPF1, partial [Symbiodinium sp. KB8]
MRADGLTASGDAFIHELSKVSERDAEAKAHRLLEKHKLSLPIPLKKVHGDPAIAGFPRLKPLDIFQYMADSGHVNKLLGGRTVQSSRLLLLDFWENYRAIHPDFEIFSSHHYSDIPLEDCIPIVAHIDGGRGYKKSEYMIFDWGAVMGSGSGKKNNKDPAVRAFKSRGNKMQLPLLGHSYTTHYLYAAMPASWHKNHEDSFQALLRVFAEDLKECFDEGVSFKGRVLRLVLIGLKGDLKMQARAGRLTRWFTTARKAPYVARSKGSGSGQCCWLCSAGDVTTPFEEIHTETPAWLVRMPTFTEPPWAPGCEGGMLRPSLSYLDRPAKFYLADLFHVYLAGVGQDFCSSCLVYMLPTCFPGSRGNSVDAQIEKLNEVFRGWKLQFKEAVHLTAFTRDKLQFFDATSAFPAGTWSKASDTARITKFIIYVCELRNDNLGAEGDKILQYIHRAARAISRFMKGLYEADLWIDFELHDYFKEKVKRPRPFVAHPDLKPCLPEEFTFSYPSGHATFYAATEELLGAWFPLQRDRIGYVSSSGVGARATCAVHYPSDANAGRKLGKMAAIEVMQMPQWQSFVSRPSPKILEELAAINKSRPYAGLPIFPRMDLLPTLPYASTDAEAVAMLVAELLRTEHVQSMAVIAPYAAQRNLLERRLSELGLSHPRLQVATVDALQGDEREVVVFSATRSNDTGALGFLSDPRRANVLLTRARRALFVVGDPRTLSCDPTWGAWLAALPEKIPGAGEMALQLSPSLEYAVMIRERACNLEAQEQQALGPSQRPAGRRRMKSVKPLYTDCGGPSEQFSDAILANFPHNVSRLISDTIADQMRLLNMPEIEACRMKKRSPLAEIAAALQHRLKWRLKHPSKWYQVSPEDFRAAVNKAWTGG